MIILVEEWHSSERMVRLVKNRCWTEYRFSIVTYRCYFRRFLSTHIYGVLHLCLFPIAVFFVPSPMHQPTSTYLINLIFLCHLKKPKQQIHILSSNKCKHGVSIYPILC